MIWEILIICLTSIIITGLVTHSLDKATQSKQAIAEASLVSHERVTGMKETSDE